MQREDFNLVFNSTLQHVKIASFVPSFCSPLYLLITLKYLENELIVLITQKTR
jgi:hypothetical protein